MNLDQFQEYDVVIVDEGQDLLSEPYFDVFEALLKHGLEKGTWKIFYDPVQNVYSGLHTNSLNELVNKGHPAKFTLSENCRNTEKIAIATHLISGIEVPKSRKVAGIEVGTSYYNDETHLRKSVSNSINRLLGGGLKPWQITILGPNRLKNSNLRRGLMNVPFDLLEDPSASFPGGTSIRYSTIRSFKGLESDAILLIDIEDLESAEAAFDLYVGGTRANTYLDFYVVKDAEHMYMERAFRFGQTLSNN